MPETEKISGWSAKSLDQQTFIEVWLDQPDKAGGSTERAVHPAQCNDTVGKMLEQVIYNRLLPIVESQGGFQIGSKGSVKPDEPLMASNWLLAWLKMESTEKVVSANTRSDLLGRDQL